MVGIGQGKVPGWSVPWLAPLLCCLFMEWLPGVDARSSEVGPRSALADAIGSGVIARSDPMLVQNAFWEGIEIALKDLSNEVSARLYRSAKSSSDAPVNSSSFSNRQYLRLVRGQFDFNGCGAEQGLR